MTKTHGIEDAVDVERRVDGHSGVEDLVPKVASAVCLGALTGKREEALWRVGDVLVEVARVSAACRGRVKLCQEGLAAGSEMRNACQTLRVWATCSRKGTYLNAKTFSYLWTKSTAGIWVCTTSQPRTAARRFRVSDSAIGVANEATYDRTPRTQSW